MNAKAVWDAYRVKMFVEGGIPDEHDQFKECVELVGGGSIVLGSGVAVGARWVLTAAHLLRRRPDVVRIRVASGTYAHAVTVHWIDGLRHIVGGGLGWPTGIETFGGASDRLVLIEFDRDLRVGLPFDLTASDPVPVGTPVFVFGHGLDGAGVHPETLMIGAMEVVGTHRGRTACRRAGATHGGAPRKLDSGAPFFVWDLDSTGRRALVGIHSYRIDSLAAGIASTPPTELACFIPIDDVAKDWIDRTVGRKTVARKSAATAAGPAFCVRAKHTCVRFTNVREFIGTWPMPFVKGTGKWLRKGDRVHVVRDGSGALIVEVRKCKDETLRFTAAVSIGGTDAAQNHWLVGTDTQAKATCYVMLMPDGTLHGIPCRRLRIEFFKENSTHPVPSALNVRDGSCVGTEDDGVMRVAECEPEGEIPDLGDDDDQDEEGEGYED